MWYIMVDCERMLREKERERGGMEGREKERENGGKRERAIFCNLLLKNPQ